MPVIMKDNVQYAYTTKGTVFHTLSNAEYEALSEEEKMNGDVYCIPDREPVINPDQLWEKVGTDTLDTTAQDLSGAVNELNANLVKYGSFSHGPISTTAGASISIANPYADKNCICAFVRNGGGNGSFGFAEALFEGNNIRIRFENTDTNVTIRVGVLYFENNS